MENAVNEPTSHIPRDEIVNGDDGGEHIKEEEIIPKEITAEIDPVQHLPNIKPKPTEVSKPTVLKVEAVQDNVKRNKRTKNRNPLTKTMKKPKITKVQETKVEILKENVKEKNFDYDDPSSFRGKDKDSIKEKNFDYDDPSTFRGKNKDIDVVLDLLETDVSKQLL